MAEIINTVEGIEGLLEFTTIDGHGDDTDFVRNNADVKICKFLLELSSLVEGKPESILLEELFEAISSGNLPNGTYPIGVKRPLKDFDPRLLIAVWIALFDKVLDRSLDIITRSPKTSLTTCKYALIDKVSLGPNE